MTQDYKISLDSNRERIYSLLTQGYFFLFQEGGKEGHWYETRSTALAGMCLEIREHGDSQWLKSVRKWLLDNQITEGDATGSWGEEIWDTAMAIIALKSFGVSSKDESIQKGLKWISALYSVNGRGNWHDEPWETSWALMAILTSGLSVEQVNIVKAIEWLISFQDTDGRIISPHYTAYFVLINSRLDKVEIDTTSRERIAQANKKAIECLVMLLEESDKDRLWTGEAWSNGQILWSLSMGRAFPVSNGVLLNKTIHWFESTQSKSGNWRDIEDTASAILGLYSLLETIVANTEGIQSAKEIYKVLQKRVPTPSLYIKRPFIERHKDIGGISINFSNRMVRVIATIGLLATISATIAQLIDFLWNHWIK